MPRVTLEVTLSAIVPLLVGLLNLLVAAYALTYGLSERAAPRGRAALTFPLGPAAVGIWALAWFVSAFDPGQLPAMRAVGGAALVLGVLGALLDTLRAAPPAHRRWMLAVAAVSALVLLAAVHAVLGPSQVDLRPGLVVRVLSLSGLGGVAAGQLLTARGRPGARGARRTVLALALCGLGYALFAGVAWLRDGVGVDVLLFVVLALELFALVGILEGRVRVEVLVARALTYALLAVVVAGLAAWIFARLGYVVDPVNLSVTVAVALIASALFMGLSDPLTARVERALFPEHARLRSALDVSRAELSALRRRLEQAERLALAGELAASVAHEIKNPLAPIRGYAQMLSKKVAALPEEQRALFDKGLGIILSETDRIDGRVAELLELSRGPLDGRGAEQVFDLQDVLREAVLVARAEPGAQQVEVTGEARRRVRGDPDAVRGALVNLLKNAAEAMQATGPGRIEVRLAEAPGEVVLEILDEGPGLPEPVRARAFDAFYTTKAGGTGLGLAIARAALESGGGHLVLRAREDGKGACAEVRLLAAREETTA